MKCNPPSKNVPEDPETLSMVPQQATSESLSSTLTTSSIRILSRRVLHVDLLSANLAASNLYLPRYSDIKFAFVSTSNDTH